MKVYKSTAELSKELTEVKETLEGFKKLVEVQKQEIYELKRFVSEDIKNKNLLHGYRKVIEDISYQVRK
jgi:anti-sigma regulatory factor (Ser/Thr protein kinase)